MSGSTHPTRTFLSVGAKLSLSTAASVLLVAATVYVGLSRYERENLLAAKDRTAHALAQLFAASLTAPLVFEDEQGVDEAVRNLARNPDVIFVRVWLANAAEPGKLGRVVGLLTRGRVDLPAPAVLPSIERLARTEGYLWIETPVSDRSQPTPIGAFQVGVSIARENTQIRSIERRVLGASVVTAAILSLLLSVLARFLIVRPLQSLSDAVQELKLGKKVRLAATANDEVGHLANRFQAMADAISIREERIKAQNRDMRLVLDNVDQGILTIDREGRIAEERSKTLDLWFGAPGEKANIVDYLTTIDEELGRKFGLAWQALTEDGAPREHTLERVPKRFARADMFFDLKCLPIVDGSRVEKALIVIDDVTRRVRREQAEREQRQLMERLHRQAGMAEIATNVLHNVGNVLNSINVSATLLMDRVAKSKASSLEKVASLIQQNEAKLGTFFVEDPRGKQLPSYLDGLSKHLLEEQKANLKELSFLRQRVEHVNEIVAMQQAFTSAAALVEEVDLRALLEQALRMNQDSLSQHKVDVSIEAEELPLVRLDKHRVLQILVNLISNAKQACRESGRSDKHVTLQVHAVDGRIRLMVIDNGVGIASENLTRIFQHGFTTRASGHGFGLHSAALAAKELGGSLQAHSAGGGAGATFALELPFEPVLATPRAG